MFILCGKCEGLEKSSFADRAGAGKSFIKMNLGVPDENLVHGSELISILTV
jgi:hypothetical protein